MNLNIHLIKVKDPELKGFEQSTSLIESMGITFDEGAHQPNWGKMKTQVDCAKNEILTYFKDNAPVENIRFGISTAPTAQYDAHTPTAEIETNKGVYVVIFQHLTFSNGILLPHNTHRGNYVHEEKPSINNLKVGADILSDILEALASKAFDVAFDKVFPKEEDAAIKAHLDQLEKDLKDFIVQQNLQGLSDKITQIRYWLRNDYGVIVDNYKAKKAIIPPSTLNDLKERQIELENITSTLDAIPDTTLSTCDFITREKCMLYVTCAALRVVVLKQQVWLLETFHMSSTDLKDITTRYIKDTSGNIERYRDKLYAARMNFISRTHTESATEDRWDYKVHPPQHILYTIDWIEWSDDFNTDKSEDPFNHYQNKRETKNYTPADDKSPGNKDQVMSELDTHCVQYIESVQSIIDDIIVTPMNNVLTELAKSQF